MIEPLMEIDGVRVERAETPENADQLARIMKSAYADGMSMAAVGGGTRLHLGNPPHSVQLAIRTGRLAGVVEYEPDNLTISIGAGTTLEEMQRVLAAENQFLPLDPPHSSGATIGGLVAANASGPIRFRYGTVRDLLIGIRVVLADGTETKAGGKLVKNVTGYDLCKLYAGSLGTLGIFRELTFKVQPMPEAIATVVLATPTFLVAHEIAQTILRADLMPDAMEALNGAAFETLTGEPPAAPWSLLLRFGETDASVRWQVDRTREISNHGNGTIADVLGADESGTCWRRMGMVREPADSEGELLLKCPVLHHSAVDTERRLRELGERLQARTLLSCHAGLNVFFGRYQWPGGTCPADAARRELRELRRQCLGAGGHMVVEKAPPDVKRGFDVWGYEAPALELMRRIKKQFDPKGLLNPGRFVGGI